MRLVASALALSLALVAAPAAAQARTTIACAEGIVARPNACTVFTFGNPVPRPAPGCASAGGPS